MMTRQHHPHSNGEEDSEREVHSRKLNAPNSEDEEEEPVSRQQKNKSTKKTTTTQKNKQDLSSSYVLDGVTGAVNHKTVEKHDSDSNDPKIIQLRAQNEIISLGKRRATYTVSVGQTK